METLILPAQQGCTKSVKFKTKALKLGDSYTQLTYHPEYDVTFTFTSSFLTVTEKDNIINRFIAWKGTTEFYWQPCENISTDIYRVQEYQVTQLSTRTFTISATFIQSKQFDCQAVIDEIDISAIPSQLALAWQFIRTYTRDTLPNYANSRKLPLNDFQNEPGRRNYFPSVCGTTEAAFLIAYTLLLLYQRTSNIEQLNYAIELVENILITLYRNVPIPSNPATATRWFPHWLYTGRGNAETKGATVTPNFLQSGNFNTVVSFTNGIGFINVNLADVYRVHNGELLWQNVYSVLIDGTNYPIDFWVDKYNRKCDVNGLSTNNTALTPGQCKLTTNFSGTAKVVWSNYTGQFVPNNEVIEAYPMHRACLSGDDLEVSHALDVSHWAYITFDLLYEITNNEKWRRATIATIASTLAASKVQNLSIVFKVDTSTNDPFSQAGVQLIKVNGKQGTLTRQVTTPFQGGLKVTQQSSVPTTYGQLELQNFVVQSIWIRNTELIAEFRINADCLLFFGLSASENPRDTSKTYYMPYWCLANTNYNKTFTRTQFTQWSTGTHWHPTNADLDLYTYAGNGGNSTRSFVMETIDSNEVLVSRLQLSRNVGFAGGGLALLENRPRLPVKVMYRATGNTELVITDADDNKFFRALPNSVTWQELNINWESLTPDIPNTTPNFNANIKNVEFRTNNSSDIYLYYLGNKPVYLGVGTYIYKHVIVNKSPQGCEWVIGNTEIKNSPLNVLPFSPGVFPFTANYIGSSRVSWEGSPYVGYQTPMLWYLSGFPQYAQQVLDFVKAAQDSYASDSPTGANWVARQVYNWARWDAATRPPYNRFVDEGADPNIAWEGYQHRAIDAVAEYWRYNPSNVTARVIVMRFLVGLFNWLNQRKQNNLPVQPPTDYIPPQQGLPLSLYVTPHGMALIIRIAVNANLAGGDRNFTITVLKDMWQALNNEFVNSGNMAGSWSNSQTTFTTSEQQYKQYYPFWHAEIIHALLLLEKEKENLRYPNC